MKISVKSTSQLSRHITIQVPSEHIEQAVAERLDNLSKKAKVAGFRTGKAPLKIIKQQYGESVRDEVIHDLMSTTLYKAIAEKKLQPVGKPSLIHDHEHHPKEGESLQFSAEFEVFPEIKLNQLTQIEIEKKSAKVSDADIDKTLNIIRKRHIVWKEVDRQAKEGDQVVIDFIGMLDGKPLEKGEAKNFSVEIGSKTLISDMEKGLIACKAGQDLKINVRFPNEYHAPQLAGKIVEFQIHVHYVKEGILPVLDEEFIRILGIKEGGIEKLRTELKKNMERELENTLQNKLKHQIMDTLYRHYPIELPKVLVAEEIHRLKQEEKKSLNVQGVTDLSFEKAHSEFENQARRRITFGLLLAEVLKQCNLQVDQKKVRAKIQMLFSTYEKPEEMVGWFYQNKKRLGEIEALVLEEQAIEKILSQVKVTEKAVSFDEAMDKN